MIISPRKLLILSLTILLLAACKQNNKGIIDRGVVIAEKAQVSNSTALVATPLAELKRGDEVDILERRSVNQREFTRVRVVGDKPLEGWMEAHFVISKRIVDECQKLAEEWKEIPTQATGRTKDKLKLRLKPGRDSDVVTMLPSGSKLDIVGRARAERHTDVDSDEKTAGQGTETVRYDNWFKVRMGSEFLIKAGWIYADSVELSPPDAIAGLLGAGRRFAAWQPFGKVIDPETNHEESNYIILDKYAYSKDDEIDFDRIYIVVWDTKIHGYSSIYIESLVRGLYPLKVDSKGDDYLFTVQLINKKQEVAPANYIIKRDPKTGQMRVSRILEPKPKAGARGQRSGIRGQKN